VLMFPVWVIVTAFETPPLPPEPPIATEALYASSLVRLPRAKLMLLPPLPPAPPIDCPKIPTPLKPFVVML